MGRDGIAVVEIDFPYFSPSFLSFFLFVLFSSFIFSSIVLLLFFPLFVYCNFLEKKKITFEDFT